MFDGHSSIYFFIVQHTTRRLILKNLLILMCLYEWIYTILYVREKTNKMQQLDVYYQHFLNMFRTSLCPSSGEQDVCYCTWSAALVLLDVVGSGCVLAPHNAAPHNRYQPHPAEPAQHTTCSNTRLVLLKMGIMMSETCWESVDNKHLTVASFWFSISLHNLLTMHGHRTLKHVSHVYNLSAIWDVV